jgi:prevent-host-death family protein
MQTVSLEEARAHLPALLKAAAAGEEIYITQNADVAVQLVPRAVQKRVRRFGSARGLIEMMPNFDEPMDDFREYQE